MPDARRRRLTRVLASAVLLPAVAGTAVAQVPGDLVAVSFRDADVRDMLQALASVTGQNIVADDTVKGRFTVEVKDVTVDQAIRAVVVAAGLKMRQEGNVLLVSKNELPPPPPSVTFADGRVTLHASAADVTKVLLQLAEATGLNVVPGEGLEGQITLHLAGLPPREVLDQIARVLKLEVKEEAQVLTVFKPVAPAPPPPEQTIEVEDGKVTLNVRDMPIRDLLDRLSTTAELNIIADDTVTDDKVTLRLSKVEPVSALEQILTSQRLSFRLRDGIYVVSKPAPAAAGAAAPAAEAIVPELTVEATQEGRISVHVVNTPVQEILDAIAARTGALITYLSTEGAAAAAGAGRALNVSLDLQDVPIEDALREILVGTGLSLAMRDERYLIGDATKVDSAGSKPLVHTEVIGLRYLKAEDAPTTLSGVVPATSIKAMPAHNAVAVTGPEDVIERVRRELETVDVPQPQVFLEAEIIDVSATASKSVGVQLGSTGGKVEADLSVGQVVFTSTGKEAAVVTATVNALVAQGKAKILARPRIATVAGKEANIQIVEDRFFRTGTITSPEAGKEGEVITPLFPFTTLQTVQAGILLRITPYVGADGDIMVEVSPEVSSVTGTGPEGLPEVSRRTATTQVRVHDGDTIVIGGLKRSERSRSRDRVPLLSEIPVIGELFRKRTVRDVESELLILITPRLLTATPPGEAAAERERVLRGADTDRLPRVELKPHAEPETPAPVPDND